MHRILVIAHRGYSSNALENSLASIRLALSLSVDMIELDVRMSKDKVLYVIHDQKTGRTANKNIDIERSTSEQISRLRLKNNEPVPTLSDVLTFVDGDCGLNLEIKSSGAGALTAEYLLSSGYNGYVLVSSFKQNEVLAARQVMPSLPISMIFNFFSARDIKNYKSRGYAVISLRNKAVDRKLVAACHEHGVKVYVWTVDEESEMRRLVLWGVDGIISNKPGVLKKMVTKFQITNKSQQPRD
jgi:glycerophosphoryl diester phosphodiesterase